MAGPEIRSPYSPASYAHSVTIEKEVALFGFATRIVGNDLVIGPCPLGCLETQLPRASP